MQGFAMARHCPPIAAGATTTFALLFAMQALIDRDEVPYALAPPAPAIDFVRVIEDEEVRTEEKVPERPEVPPPPVTPPIDPVVVEGTGVAPIVPGAVAPPTGPVKLAGSGVAVPIVEVPPEYPRRCAARGIEGWVLLKFDIGTIGAPENIQVLEAEPEGCFERSAAAAVARFRYRPATRDDTPVVQRGVLKRMTFRLDG